MPKEPSEQIRATPRRRKGSGNGKDRSRKPTPLQLERQEKVYDLSIDGYTVRQIAKVMVISQETVITDLREESKRRSAELGERRDDEKARSVAYYEKIARKAVAIATKPKMPGDSGRLADAIKARERIDKVLGIDSPTRIDATVQGLRDALIGE